MDYIYYDLANGRQSDKLDLIMPDFSAVRETVGFVSPHDDDALLGAGCLITALQDAGAAVKIAVVCDGSGGYSRPGDKENIVQRRKSESLAAYSALGVAPSDIAFLDLPDFSALHYLGWRLPSGGQGLFAKMLPLFRKWRVTRLALPNGHREHIDHTAAHQAGAFFGPQTGDAVLADWGAAPAVRSYLVYSVWAAFPPRPDGSPGADLAVSAPARVEERVMESLRRFESQRDVIAGLLEARAARVRNGRVLELFMSLEPRPLLDFSPYWDMVEKIGL